MSSPMFKPTRCSWLSPNTSPSCPASFGHIRNGVDGHISRASPCFCRSAAARAHGHRVHKNHKNFISCLDGKLQSIPHDRPFFLSSAGHKSTLLLIAPAPAPAPWVFITTRHSSGDLINKSQMGRKPLRSFWRGSNSPLQRDGPDPLQSSERHVAQPAQ